jgi:hypothetical protein
MPAILNLRRDSCVEESVLPFSPRKRKAKIEESTHEA